MTDPLQDLDTDPALAAAVLEIETHSATAGWDRPATLYALVETAALVAQEPALAEELGLDGAAEAGSLTAVEQDRLPHDQPLERVLETIAWPPEVAGCAAVVERLVLPPGSDDGLPEDPVAAQEYAADHPDRQEVRIVAGATRGGATYCALRLRSHDEASSVVGGVDLVPNLLTLLSETLREHDETERDQTDPEDTDPMPNPEQP
jgi:hypothetical protein